MDRDQARTIIAGLPLRDPATAFRQGLDLLRNDFPELVLPVAQQLARRYPSDHRLHQLLGLAARATGNSAIARAAFAAAARLAPHDPLLAHSHARAALEAGAPAADLFLNAARLAPSDGAVLQGLAAAQFHEGQVDAAIDLLQTVLGNNPGWLDGHRDLAHLYGQMGLAPLAAIDRALAREPALPALHQLRITLALEARDLARAEQAVASALAAIGHQPWLDVLAGHVASEQGDIARADQLFAAAAPLAGVDQVSLVARHLLRAGRPGHAAALIEPMIEQDHDHMLWPYLSLAWRLCDDPRWSWLEQDPALVGVYDLGLGPDQINALAAELRRLHVAKAAPLDQSVRGGTQTDGNLLLRTTPELQQLRSVLLAAVDQHIAQLPPAVAGHPTLLAARDPVRIAGSWSVRLTAEGFHTDHVHGSGWLSSALYLVLPETIGTHQSGSHDGWLALGECRELVPGLAPLRLVEPKVGRLVLFPSTMWHGTRPFSSGERMTVAFDIARPKQSRPA